MNDFEYQLNYVKENSRRILSMQDTHTLSPSYGCFHYAYWRDKVSEFADIRFQEAGATLGLSTHPLVYDPSLPPKEELYRGFSAGITFWNKQQHPDGSFDEWYKNEHGFAATTFSLIAYGLAVYFMDNEVKAEDKSRFLQTAEKAAQWLLKYDDFIKMNHQAAGAAALAIMYRITGDELFQRGAIKKHQDVLETQTEEGWFNEIAGMDLGYCSVLLDYMMIYRYMMNDNSGLAAMKKLYEFMFPFIQPDLTISPEAGICLNPYVSRLGTVLLSEHSPEAAAVAKKFNVQSAGYAGIAPYLADDLRLCRWSYLPLITQILRSEMEKSSLFAKAYSPSSLSLSKETFYKQAGIFSYKSDGFHVIFLPAGGGIVRIFYLDKKTGALHTYEDLGYVYSDPAISPYELFTGGYSTTRRIEKDKDTITTYVQVIPAKFFFPPFIARLALRLSCTVPYLSYWSRKLIDLYRKKKGTAINQSIAPVGGHNIGITLKRQLATKNNSFKIIDEISCGNKEISLNLDNLKPFISNNGKKVETKSMFKTLGNTPVKSVNITKEIRVSDNGLHLSFSVKSK